MSANIKTAMVGITEITLIEKAAIRVGQGKG